MFDEMGKNSKSTSLLYNFYIYWKYLKIQDLKFIGRKASLLSYLLIIKMLSWQSMLFAFTHLSRLKKLKENKTICQGKIKKRLDQSSH